MLFREDEINQLQEKSGEIAARVAEAEEQLAERVGRLLLVVV